MKRKVDMSFDPHEFVMEERRRDIKLAKAFVTACAEGDVDKMFSAANYLSDCSVDGWRLAFKKIVRMSPPPDKLRKAFLSIWIQSKSIQQRVGDDLLTIDGLRILTPPYRGPERTLYRGDIFRNRCHRTYGLAWSADRETAIKHAQNNKHRMLPGGSVLIQTTAPSDAIITTSHHIGDPFGEDEYIVDRRCLGPVRVVERYSEIALPPMPQLRNPTRF